MVDIDKANRIGAQYRSAMKYTVSGNVKFTNPAVPPPFPGLAYGLNSTRLYNSGVKSQIKLPEIVNVSYFGNINPQ